LKFHGLGVDAYDRLVQGRKPQAEVIEPGFKYNLPDMNAVLGIGQLNRLDSINQRRAELAALYSEGFATIDEIIPQQQPDYDFQHSWALYVIRLDTDPADLNRDDFMQALQQRGIGTGLHFRAVHTQKYFREYFAGQKFELSNTEWNSDRICSIPLFPDMKNEDVTHVVNTIKSVLRKH
jgi:UDP-4-amino-4-deoxy-L-arabinose-oxoglutarate aminotransferase